MLARRGGESDYRRVTVATRSLTETLRESSARDRKMRAHLARMCDCNPERRHVQPV